MAKQLKYTTLPKTTKNAHHTEQISALMQWPMTKSSEPTRHHQHGIRIGVRPRNDGKQLQCRDTAQNNKSQAHTSDQRLNAVPNDRGQ